MKNFREYASHREALQGRADDYRCLPPADGHEPECFRTDAWRGSVMDTVKRAQLGA